MDAILILGAAVWSDGPSPTLVRRTEHAARLWHDLEAKTIVACGGLGQFPPTEAAAMREILIGKGIPPNVILCEEKSTTTLENIEFTLPILREHAINHVMIVTDATHAPRAAMVARHFGLKAKVSSPSWRGARKRTVLRQVIREAVALPIYALRLRRIPRTGPKEPD